MKKSFYLRPKKEFIEAYGAKEGKSEKIASQDIVYAVEFRKIGLDEFVIFDGKLIPVLEFFEKVEYEKGVK